MKAQGLNQNTKEIKRWEFRQFHQAHMNSDGQYWDFDILFYGEKIGEGTLCYVREYEEEGPIIMNPRNSWVTDQLERVEVNDLDSELHHTYDEVMWALEKEYSSSQSFILGGGLYTNLLDEGFISE